MGEAAAVLERPETENQEWPNKFIYPEFAGFAGENRVRKLVRCILPLALYRTWEIFIEEQGYGNDCYLGMSKMMELSRRGERTVQRNLASLISKGLLVLRTEQKVFVNADGSLRKKAVVVKDFAGLYALAHEYYQWYQSEDYIEPDRAFVKLIRQDERLLAKLRRFEDYRRILYNQPCREMQPREEDRWFTDYDPEKQAESVKEQESSQDPTFLTTKMATEVPTKMSPERINEKDYSKSLQGDSFDSGPDLQNGGEASAEVRMYSQNRASVAPGYTKETKEKTSKTNASFPHPTNQPSSVPENRPTRLTGKRRESAEEHPDVRKARQAMAAAGIEAGQVEEKRPPKHVLARSFVHEMAAVFGDLNEKGSITRIERSIEAAGLTHPAEVLMCLVRAYAVARETKEENVRHRHPRTGIANRMPLFCSMVERFLQARATGGKWEYSWQDMEADIQADDRLGLWLSEHQALLGEPETEEEQVEETSETEQEQADAPVIEEAQASSSYQQEEPQTCRFIRSQTAEEREARAALARKVMMRLLNRGVPIVDPRVDGEHYACGCPLSYASTHPLAPMKRVCALCYPDPSWSDEVVALIRSIVVDQQELPGAGWSDRTDAYIQAERLLQAIVDANYVGFEIKLSEGQDGRYFVVYRVLADGAEDIVLGDQVQIDYLIEQAELGTL
jgi:hypothetical protein